MLRRLFGQERKPSLLPSNVGSDWMQGAWREWEPPANIVVGESHHLESFMALAGAPRPTGYFLPVSAEFVREAENPYDGNAVRVQVQGLSVGHIKRDIAADISQTLDEMGCSSFSLAGVIRGGSTTAPNFGVQVWLDRRLTPAPSFQHLTVALANWPAAEDAAWEEPASDNAPRDPLDQYYWLLGRIEELWGHGQYLDVLPLCLRSLDLLPVVLGEAPDIGELPALGYAASILAATGDGASLRDLQQRWEADPTMSRWAPVLEEGSRDLTLTSAVLALAAQQPGIVQKDLHEVIPGASKQRIQSCCYWAAAVGRLERQKAGVSYALQVPPAVLGTIGAEAIEGALTTFGERPDSEDDSSATENSTPLDDLLRPVDARLDFKEAPAPYEDAAGYERWRRHYDGVHGLTVERNLRGVRAEKANDIEAAILLYEANVRDGFEGNHPYDRLAIIYRKRKWVGEEIRVLERAVQVFSSLSPERSDVSPKLTKFKSRLEKARQIVGGK